MQSTAVVTHCYIKCLWITQAYKQLTLNLQEDYLSLQIVATKLKYSTMTLALCVCVYARTLHTHYTQHTYTIHSTHTIHNTHYTQHTLMLTIHL